MVLLGNLGNWRGHGLGFWATEINSLLHHAANHHYGPFQRPAAVSVVIARKSTFLATEIKNQLFNIMGLWLWLFSSCYISEDTLGINKRTI